MCVIGEREDGRMVSRIVRIGGYDRKIQRKQRKVSRRSMLVVNHLQSCLSGASLLVETVILGARAYRCCC